MKRKLLYFAGGIFSVCLLHASPTTHYVDLNSTNATPPFTDWSTAATNIQDAIDAAVDGDSVLVTNGVYAVGGRRTLGDPNTNRVVVNKVVILQSINGPQATIISGHQVPGRTNWVGAIRCVWLTNGAVLSGFTLTNGATSDDGDGSCGGVRGLSATLGQALTNGCIVSNCIIAGCSAYFNAGGAMGCTLNNCILSNNTTSYGWAGGAQYCILNNCTLTGNAAGYGQGGGADNSLLNSCVLIANKEVFNGNNWGGGGASRSTLNNCFMINNSATVQGGAALNCTLNNCVVASNSATFGGGAAYCTLNNCTIIGNSAATAGGGVGDLGAVKSILNNCIAFYNTAPTGSNTYGYYNELKLNYSCTTPAPTNGMGNITSEPAFLNLIAGDFHLQSNSPCINSGRNAYATNATDLNAQFGSFLRLCTAVWFANGRFG
jgi:hypothetical protein